MIYVEAPNYEHDNNKDLPKLFLGGGITNCKDWQSDIVEELQDIDCIIYNPRRKTFDISDPLQSEIQIRWEHKYLNESDIVIFYFSSETLCPITLFELGARLAHNTYLDNQSIYIYCEPSYGRKFDVAFQTHLAIKNYSQKFECIYHSGLNPSFKYDVRCFDNYDVFLLTLRERIKKGKNI